MSEYCSVPTDYNVSNENDNDNDRYNYNYRYTGTSNSTSNSDKENDFINMTVPQFAIPIDCDDPLSLLSQQYKQSL